MLKKILGLLSDAALYGSAGVVSQVLGFFLLPIYTRFLAPADFGILAMLTLFSTLYVPFANLGMTNAIFRRFNLSKNDDERSTVLFSGGVSVSVATLVLGCLCHLAAPFLTELLLGQGGDIFLVRLAITIAMLESLIAVPMVILRADRQVRTVASVSIARLLVSIGVTIGLVVFAKFGVLGVVLGNLSGSSFALLALGYFARHNVRPIFSRDVWWMMFKYGAPFMPHTIQTVGLVMVGQYMVRQIDGLQAAGVFSIALKFAIPVSFVVNSIQKAWVPFKFQVHAEEEDSRPLFRTIITYYFVIITYLWVGVSYWGPELLRVMTTPAFHSAAFLVAAVASISMTQGFRFMLTTGMEFRDNMRVVPLITFVGLIVVITGCYVLIPILGPSGAALGTSLGWLVMAFLGFSVARRRFDVGYNWLTLIGTVIAAVLFVLVSLWSQHNQVLWQRLLLAITASLAYPCGAVALLLQSKNERERAFRLVDKAKAYFRNRKRKDQ